MIKTDWELVDALVTCGTGPAKRLPLEINSTANKTILKLCKSVMRWFIDL